MCSVPLLAWKWGRVAAIWGYEEQYEESPLGSSAFDAEIFLCYSCSSILRTDKMCFFPCHLHLCSWHFSYRSRSVSISAGFCCNAFQISWCFEHFFFNLTSKHLALLWSPRSIQIRSTLGLPSHTLQFESFEASRKIRSIFINYLVAPNIYIEIYSQS